MKNLQLLPSTFCDESIVKVSFTYDQELIQTVNPMDGSQWSLSLKSWYFKQLLLEQGVSLRHIQKLLGHSSSKTTEIYTQVSMQEIGRIKNPLDDFYKTKSSTIHANLGCIVEQNSEYNENMHT